MAEFTVDRAAAWLSDYARQISRHASELTELDRQIGDADHGSNMDRGMQAVTAIDAHESTSAAEYLKKVAMALLSNVGGAAGPLYGTFFLRFAASLPATDAELTAQQLAAAFRAGVDGVQQRGKAERGDKTMVDALLPAVEALETTAKQGVRPALAAAATSAELGRLATVPMLARKGRASYLGERSIGHQDPGATSAAMLIESATRTLG